MDDLYRDAVAAAREAGQAFASETMHIRAGEAFGRVVERISHLQRNECEGADESGSVVARVDGNGRLVGLKISAGAVSHLKGELLETHCVQAIANARAAMAKEFGTAMAEIVAEPDDSWRADAEAAVAAFKERFGSGR